jgi:bifunctional non-homologous end joining protein LigD
MTLPFSPSSRHTQASSRNYNVARAFESRPRTPACGQCRELARPPPGDRAFSFGGIDLRQQTLSERRAELKNLVGAEAESRIQFSEEFDGDGAALFRACAEKELEGIVSKHSLAPYRSGRSRTWLKTKCFTESIFVVVGTDRDRKTGALMALLAHSDGLKYAGAAFITLNGDERKEFLAEVERLTTSWGAFKSSRATDVRWCQPRLRCE